MAPRWVPTALIPILLALAACRPAAWNATIRLPASKPVRYHIRVSPNLRSIRVRLDLPRLPRGRRLFLVPTQRWQQRLGQIRWVRCGERALTQGPRPWTWQIPAGCRRITWKVRVDWVAPNGYDVAHLRAAVNPGRQWVILPGVSWMLLVYGLMGPATLTVEPPSGARVHHGLDRLPDGSLRLPELPSALCTTVGVGRFLPRRSRVSGVIVQHLFARPPPARFDALLRASDRGLAYLLQVFGRPRASRLGVFWFQLRALTRAVSGYSCNRMVTVSFVDQPPAASFLSPAIRPWLPAVAVLHEQVHQLSGKPPAWVRESLAQYYALKALGRAGALAAADWTRAVDRITRPWDGTPPRDRRLTLLAAQHRYRRTGDVRAFAIFYSNGARFWWIVDQAIGARSKGAQSLDAIAARLLRLRYHRDGRPPPAFGALLRGAAGPAADAIIAKWVGR